MMNTSDVGDLGIVQKLIDNHSVFINRRLKNSNFPKGIDDHSGSQLVGDRQICRE